jgi:hypothetical protein
VFAATSIADLTAMIYGAGGYCDTVSYSTANCWRSAPVAPDSLLVAAIVIVPCTELKGLAAKLDPAGVLLLAIRNSGHCGPGQAAAAPEMYSLLQVPLKQLGVSNLLVRIRRDLDGEIKTEGYASVDLSQGVIPEPQKRVAEMSTLIGRARADMAQRHETRTSIVAVGGRSWGENALDCNAVDAKSSASPVRGYLLVLNDDTNTNYEYHSDGSSVVYCGRAKL